MRTSFRYCSECQRYSLAESCPQCSSSTVVPVPARFSPQDRWGQYRRKLKQELKQEQLKDNTI